MSNRKPSKKLTIAKQMPPLFHTLPGKDFAPDYSQVLDWMSKQPDLLMWIFDTVSSAKLIIYNPDTGLWKGADYDD